MNSKLITLLIGLFFGITVFGQSFENAPIISVEDYKTLAKTDTNFTLIDLRKIEDYNEGHIESAINLWRTHIVDSTLIFGGMKISRDSIQSLFSRIGVQSTDRIIIYDAKGDVDAARLWWILFNYGHKNVALLNGGLTEWERQSNAITQAVPPLIQSEYNFPNKEDYSLSISLEGVKAAIKDSNTIILDTRSFDEFVGNTMKNDAYRKGRIPNSILIDWAEGINYNGDRKFKTASELHEIYNFNNAPKNQPIITYCQSGVRSAHTTFILTKLLGYTNVRNYDGSWIEWSYHSELEIETGEPTTSNDTENTGEFDVIPWLFIICPILLLALGIFLVYRKK